MRCLVLLAVCGACGDNRLCDWRESDDTANETTPEMTTLSLGGGGEQNLCGAIDGGHSPGGTIDVDRYRVTIGGDGRLLVEIEGGAGAELLEGLEVRIFDTRPVPTLLAAGSYDPKLGDFGAFLADVTLGDYDVWVSARVAGALTGTIDYRVRITADLTDACTTTDTNYTESADGSDDKANDTVAVDYGKVAAFSMMSGTPEATRLNVEAADHFKIAGSAGGAARMDQYLDRDTYAFTTDETTNELTVKLDWMDAGDLDYLVFEANKMVPVGAGQLTSTSQHEVATFPVRASTPYWLWIGRYRTSIGSSPIPYEATVCGGHFFH